MKIAFYIPHFNNIGGIESWIYYIGKLYGDNRNITVYYSTGDEKQIERLSKVIKVHKFYFQKIKCDVAIFCAVVPDSEILCFDASKEKVQFIHACYSAAYNIKEFKKNPLIDRYIAVSQTAADDFYNLTKSMPEVMYNPIYLEKPRRVLKLISATRIARDKGSIWGKMRILAKKLNEANIPFIWLVFTNNPQPCELRGIVFMPSELSITDYIAEADYLVQLSKTEAFAYSVVESLALGTPVLATNFAAAREMGLENGKNGYIFNMEMDNVDVDKIYNHIPKFEHKLKTSEKEWKDLLGPALKKLPVDEKVTVQCIRMEGFRDPQTGQWRKYKEKWECSQEDAEYMIEYRNPNSFTTGPLVDIID
jgi:glycosyltransferase involved in cell wall biosynthesis